MQHCRMTSTSALTESGPGSRPPVERSARQKRVIEAARQLFSTQGYAATSLREVARASEITHAGVLRIFGSKAELLLAVLEERDYVDSVRYGRGIGKGKEGLETIFDVLRDNAREPQLIRFYTRMAAEATEPTHPAHEYFVRRYQGGRVVVEGFLRQMQDAGELREATDTAALAALIVAAMDGLQLQLLLDAESVTPIAYIAGMIRPFLTDSNPELQR